MERLNFNLNWSSNEEGGINDGTNSLARNNALMNWFVKASRDLACHDISEPCFFDELKVFSFSQIPTSLHLLSNQGRF